MWYFDVLSLHVHKVHPALKLPVLPPLELVVGTAVVGAEVLLSGLDVLVTSDVVVTHVGDSVGGWQPV